MTTSLIPVQNLFFAFAPLSFVFWIFYFWKLDLKRLVLACVRMLSQLILIGYLLKIIFKFESAYFTFPIVFFMMSVSAWIALQSISNERKRKSGGDSLMEFRVSLITPGGISSSAPVLPMRKS